MEKAVVKKIAERVKPSSYLDYKEYLEAFYKAVKKEKGRYSYTRFAEELGFSPSNIIHQFVNGRRPLTPKTANKIAAAIPVRGIERRYLIGLSSLQTARSASKKEEILQALLELKKQLLPTPVEKDMINYYSRWYCSIIREMVRLDNFQSDTEWISRQLEPNIKPEEAEKSLKILEKLGHIRFDDGLGRHVIVEENVSTGHETSGMEIIKYHSEMIDIGRDALTRVDSTRRDHSVVTVCVSEEKVQKLKSMIHQFQMELLSEDEEPQQRDQVYQVNIQMFPFTKS